MDGLLIINKPPGITSHDVVARVRRILNERSVGHLGTLDPSATGVLPLLVGRFTRLAAFYNDADKRYRGVIHFGQATDSYDSEGEPLGANQPVTFSLHDLREAAAKFVGTIRQTPPLFSAKKIAGVPAYKLARRKENVELEPKEVEVKEFQILDFDGRSARFTAWVGSGTYIRSLAHDLGKALGPGAHLGELSRTAVREFVLEGAHTTEELEQSVTLHNTSYQTLHTSGNWNYDSDDASIFLHPRLILPEFPAVTAPPDTLVKIRHGAAVNLPFFESARTGARLGQIPLKPLLIRVFADQTRLIAVARQIAGTLFHPKIVLL